MPFLATKYMIAGLVSLLVIGAGYGYIVYKQVQARTQVAHLTRIIEGTPGPQGEPGLGIKDVKVRILPAGSKPSARVKQQTLYLAIPRGTPGLQGERGPQGKKGDTGDIGPAGFVSQERITSAIEEFFHEHTLTCRFVGHSDELLTCRVN